jgi:hypothetical protein
MAIRKRSKSREKFLDKMFRARMLLKNKFNYMETHPWESRIFRTTLVAYRINVYNPWSVRRFEKIWRKKMDRMFDLSTLEYKKRLIKRMIGKEDGREAVRGRNQITPTQPDKIQSNSNDPIARMLINYDREVLAMIREINRQFSHYLQYPHRYPHIEAEKKKFLIEESRTSFNNNVEMMDIDVDFHSQPFKDFWSRRAGNLCDEKVVFEKNLLRCKWRFAVRNYLRLSKDPKVEDLKNLLASDNEDDPEVEIIEREPSVIVISSDED